MLNSRYIHLHQALGLGSMWLNQQARIRPPEGSLKAEGFNEVKTSNASFSEVKTEGFNEVKTGHAGFSEAKTMGRDDFQAAAEVSPRLCPRIENAQFAVFRFFILACFKIFQN